MNDLSKDQKSKTRRLSCVRCGMEFGCDLSGDCWCVAEEIRLPMPALGGDCLCPACLRAMAENS